MSDVLLSIANDHGYQLEHLEVMPDHVHGFIGAKPSVSPANIARILKGASSRMFLHGNPQFRSVMRGSEHLWNPSYYIGTVGDMSKSVVVRYIAQQRQEHDPNTDKTTT